MTLNERLMALKALGKYIENLSISEKEYISKSAYTENAWFVKEAIDQIIKQVILNLGQLEKWVKKYDFFELKPKKIGVISSGNIPLSGFQDWLCVLISGHHLMLKTSQRDTFLIKYLTKQLLKIEPRFKNSIIFQNNLKECSALITSSSKNTSRYFDYYFANHPKIIRKHRSSCAIVTGKESSKLLKALADDVFTYFGLGCRNVSKIYLTQNIKIEQVLDLWQKKQEKKFLTNHKYRNNYNYNKAILLVNQIPHLDTGYVLIEENKSLNSPIGTIYYEYIADIERLKTDLVTYRDELQCLVALPELGFPMQVNFGKTQKPDIWDYPDQIDTLAFLLNQGI